jgi:aminoglycoside 3-N-acetyltransferase I
MARRSLPAFQTQRLSRHDLSVMREVNRLFAAAFKAPSDYPDDAPDDEVLADRLADPNIIALAAVAGTKIIGGLTAYVLRKLEQERSEIYIYDLAVAEDWRREGVATALIDRVRRIANEVGAWVIFVQADHGDDPAIALYTGLGAREDVLHFDIQPATHRGEKT